MQISKSKNSSLKKAMDKSDQDTMRRELETIRKGHGLSNLAHSYLDQIVDCSTKKPVGAPTLMGGVPGKTSVFRLKEEIRVVIGTSGYGYFSVNYSDLGVTSGVKSGPFSDGAVFSYTTSAFVGTDLVLAGTANPVGVVNKGWTLSRRKLTDYASSSDPQNEYQWRMVAGLAECTNTTAVLSQNGTIVMWEPPNHAPVNSIGNYDITGCESERTSRVVRAENGSEPGDKVALNFHPRMLASAAGSSDSNDNDFFFNTFTNAPTVTSGRVPVSKHAIFILQGSPGDSFHFTVSAVYEAKGRLVSGIKPRLTDEHGMNIVFNTLAAKALDGYIGNPRRIADGYLAKAWETAKKIGGWVKQHESTIMKGTGAFLKGMAGLE
jgi:hypothetical protein